VSKSQVKQQHLLTISVCLNTSHCSSVFSAGHNFFVFQFVKILYNWTFIKRGNCENLSWLKTEFCLYSLHLIELTGYNNSLEFTAKRDWNGSKKCLRLFTKSEKSFFWCSSTWHWPNETYGEVLRNVTTVVTCSLLNAAFRLQFLFFDDNASTAFINSEIFVMGLITDCPM